MVNSKAVYRPKDFGGLGVINSRLFNDCLLSKWLWKIDQARDELWFRILKAKYFPDRNSWGSKVIKGSQFWNNLHRVKHLFLCGVNHVVGDGKSVSFWRDVWIDHCPLKVRFYKLAFH